jgi:ribosomal protein S18 acetylase RimI-like enzyme
VQRWELALLARAAEQVPLDVIRPFRAIPGAKGAELGFDYALPVDAVDPTLADGIGRLRERYRQLSEPLRLEFNEELWPGLAAALEAAGFVLQNRNPLMACTPADFRRRASDSVTVDWSSTIPGQPSTLRVSGLINGSVAGYASLGDLEGVAELYGVVTEPPFRRQGVAATLCSALVERHFERGGTMVFLDADSSDAARLYGRLGFRVIGTRLTYHAPD